MSSLSEITQALIDLLASDNSLGLTRVYYGDQQGYPSVPSATIEHEGSTREYTQTGLQTTRTVECVVIVYHGKAEDVQTVKKELDQYAQAVENRLHSDSTLGGLVINGLVTSMEPGTVLVGRSNFYAHRLTWEGLVKERIGI